MDMDITPPRSTAPKYVSCEECGTVFANEDFLDEHTCPDSGKEEEDDNCGWDQFLDDIKATFETEFEEIVEHLTAEGKSAEAAKQEAMKTLFPKFKKKTYRAYAKLLQYSDCLKENTYHNDVVDAIENLMDEKEYSREKAIRVALDQNKSYLREMFKEKFETLFEEATSDSDTDSDDQSDD